MAGLLDFLNTDEGRLGLGLLAAAGPRSDGMGFGGRVQEAFQGQDARKKQQAEAEWRKLQMEEARDQMAQRQQATAQAGYNQAAVRNAFSPMGGGAAMSNGQGPTLGNAANLGQMQAFDPRTFLAQNPSADISALKQAMELNQAFNPARKLMNVAPGASVIDERDPTKALFTGPKEATLPSAVQEYQFAQSQGYTSGFDEWKKSNARAGATNISNNNISTQENEQSKTYGKGMGDLRIDLQKSAFNAPTKLAKIERMEQLLRGVEGGKFADLGKEVASAAQALGFKIDPNLGNKEAAAALSVEMALDMKQPGSGPTTDKDFDSFMLTVPGLSKTPEGRKQISATMKAKAKRDIEIAKMARSYASKNRGSIDDGFLDLVSQYTADNPVVPYSPKTPIDNLLTKYPPRK